MKKKITKFMNNAQMHKSRGYSKMFTAILCMALVFILFNSSCKKDNFVAVQGVCPTVLTDPMDEAVVVVLTKVITATFNTAINSTTINI